MMIEDDSSFSFVAVGPGGEALYTPSHTEQHTDEFDLVSEHAESFDQDRSVPDSKSDCSTSVTPSIYQHERAHGRMYHSYKSGRYPRPNDVLEQQLEDLKHILMLELTEGHLFLSDLGENPQRILDIGTGSGTWAIDTADRYPEASVIGTDLSPIQPPLLPPNCRMFIDDCEEDEWLHGGGYDFIHLRGVFDYLHNPDAVLSKIYNNLKVGGWVELQAFIPEICCHDSSMEPNDLLRQIMRLAVRGTRKLGCKAYGKESYRQSLEEAGFSNIQQVIYTVPIGGWPQDERQQDLGNMMKAVISESLDGLAAKPLHALGISEAERMGMVANARRSLGDAKIHRYMRFSFCFGQRTPEDHDLVSDTDSGVIMAHDAR